MPETENPNPNQNIPSPEQQAVTDLSVAAAGILDSQTAPVETENDGSQLRSTSFSDRTLAEFTAPNGEKYYQYTEQPGDEPSQGDMVWRWKAGERTARYIVAGEETGLIDEEADIRQLKGRIEAGPNPEAGMTREQQLEQVATFVESERAKLRERDMQPKDFLSGTTETGMFFSVDEVAKVGDSANAPKAMIVRYGRLGDVGPDAERILQVIFQPGGYEQRRDGSVVLPLDEGYQGWLTIPGDRSKDQAEWALTHDDGTRTAEKIHDERLAAQSSESEIQLSESDRIGIDNAMRIVREVRHEERKLRPKELVAGVTPDGRFIALDDLTDAEGMFGSPDKPRYVIHTGNLSDLSRGEHPSEERLTYPDIQDEGVLGRKLFPVGDDEFIDIPSRRDLKNGEQPTLWNRATNERQPIVSLDEVHKPRRSSEVLSNEILNKTLGDIEEFFGRHASTVYDPSTKRPLQVGITRRLGFDQRHERKLLPDFPNSGIAEVAPMSEDGTLGSKYFVIRGGGASPKARFHNQHCEWRIDPQNRQVFVSAMDSQTGQYTPFEQVTDPDDLAQMRTSLHAMYKATQTRGMGRELQTEWDPKDDRIGRMAARALFGKP
jgi:hypothetical protein